MPSDSRDVFQEGLVIPPVRLVRRGEIVRDVFDMVLANSRTPRLRRGDLRAQIAANSGAARRLAELAGRRGLDVVLDAFGDVVAYSERMARRIVAELPDGSFRAESEIEGEWVVVAQRWRLVLHLVGGHERQCSPARASSSRSPRVTVKA